MRMSTLLTLRSKASSANMSMPRQRMSAILWMSSYPDLESDRSMPMTTSAPICRARSTGKLLRMPPSTRTMPFVRTGAKRPGMDIVERIAVPMLPLCHTFALPETTSVATQANGIGRRRKSVESAWPGVMLEIRYWTFWPKM